MHHLTTIIPFFSHHHQYYYHRHCELSHFPCGLLSKSLPLGCSVPLAHHHHHHSSFGLLLIYTHWMPLCLLMYTRNLFYCLLLRHSTPHLFKSIPSFVGRSFSTTSSSSASYIVSCCTFPFHFDWTSLLYHKIIAVSGVLLLLLIFVPTRDEWNLQEETEQSSYLKSPVAAVEPSQSEISDSPVKSKETRKRISPSASLIRHDILGRPAFTLSLSAAVWTKR